MKALTLAAVIALSATGAAALDTNEILTKGIKITEFDAKLDDYRRKDMLYLYNSYVYYCPAYLPNDLRPTVRCLPSFSTKVD